nr:copper chaperone PCu(A)C [Mycoavidus sp. B2-EB]
MTLLLASLCFSVFSSAASAATPPEVVAEAGWVRWLPDGRPAAGYMTLRNHSAQAIDVVAASSPDYGHVMLHQSVSNGTQSRMVHLKKLTLPAHGEVKLAPGGYHLMLEKARTEPALKPGDTVQVKLTLSDGTFLHLTLPVRPPATL